MCVEGSRTSGEAKCGPSSQMRFLNVWLCFLLAEDAIEVSAKGWSRVVWEQERLC